MISGWFLGEEVVVGEIMVISDWSLRKQWFSAVTGETMAIGLWGDDGDQRLVTGHNGEE